MRSDYPSTASQENFLCLLCFNKKAATIIRGHVDSELFESSVYRKIAELASGYLDSYGEPVGQHLPDLLEDVLNGDDPRKARLYRNTILHLKGMFDEGLNEEYCLSQLTGFVRSQSLKRAIMQAAEAAQSNDIDGAERAFNDYWRGEYTAFHPGLFLSDSSNLASFLYASSFETIPTGIPYLDTTSFGLEPKTVLTVVAPTGRGKTWALVHLGKMAAIHRKKVLHISLEMDDEKVKARYVQSYLAIAKRQAEQEITRFETQDGAVSKFKSATVKRPTLRDPKIATVIVDRAKKIQRQMSLIVKSFPTNSLTIKGLESYLDSLDRHYHFQPDVVLIDYLDLMRVSTEALRLDLNQLFKDFRRVCGERNIAGGTASQTNRTGEGARVVTLKHLAEDYSKAQTSDRVLTYNQTAHEKKRGLARLYVAKNRDEEDSGLVIVSQNYHTGQFCLDSALMSRIYIDQILEGGDD